MPEQTDTRRGNRALWIALLLAIAAVACNVGFFINAPGQRLLPWLSLVLAVSAVDGVVIGFRRLGAQSSGRKALQVAVGVLSLLLVAFTGFAFVKARELPATAEAPQVGQRVPDFTLQDAEGRPVSLSQLFAAADAGGTPPKAVLLVFYRG